MYKSWRKSDVGIQRSAFRHSLRNMNNEKKNLLKLYKVMATPVFLMFFSECRMVTKIWRKKKETAARHHGTKREIIKVKMQWE